MTLPLRTDSFLFCIFKMSLCKTEKKTRFPTRRCSLALVVVAGGGGDSALPMTIQNQIHKHRPNLCITAGEAHAQGACAR